MRVCEIQKALASRLGPQQAYTGPHGEPAYACRHEPLIPEVVGRRRRQVSWLTMRGSSPSFAGLPAALRQWPSEVVGARDMVYSCGYSSGFPPDSLFIPSRSGHLQRMRNVETQRTALIRNCEASIANCSPNPSLSNHPAERNPPATRYPPTRYASKASPLM